ncbi:Integron cassette protein [Candidatus Magnetomoraceae bacterium gMMP-15]
MKSEHHGKIISEVEVTNISSHGIWLFSRNQEMFLSYHDFPWFKDVSVGSIINIQEPVPNHFYWPDLDIDLSKEIIKHPERFPMKANIKI